MISRANHNAALAAKDAEIARLREENAALSKLTANKFRVVTPCLETAQAVYGRTVNMPLIGRFVRLGVRVADVGVSRLTPFANCADLNDKISTAIPYIDEQVISPQINAVKVSVVALCGPAVEAAREAADPYITAVKPYVDKALPYASKGTGLARSILARLYIVSAPVVEKLEIEAEKELEVLDKMAANLLEKTEPETVYATLQQKAAEVAKVVGKIEGTSPSVRSRTTSAITASSMGQA